MAITPLPDPPSRQDPTNFAAEGDALLGALPTFVSEANALETNVNANEVTASAAAVTATTQAGYAEDSATVAAASAAASAEKWVSGTTYTEGDTVWSPADYQTYRRKTNGAGTTDPSSDTTNWIWAIHVLPFTNNEMLSQTCAIALYF